MGTSNRVRALIIGCMAALLGSSCSTLPPSAHNQTEGLHLDTYTAQLSGLGVTSTLIYGPHEAILVDSQYNISDATRLADRIAARGRRLVAIVISHPDDDHYLGTAVLHERFPDTPIYMTAPALEHFKRTSARSLAAQRKYAPSETPDSVPTPQVLPATHFAIDGQPIEVITDLQGDVLEPSNSFVWVPSLRAVIAGDIVFNRVHVWLADSSAQSRLNWQTSLRRVASYHPLIVVAGHKKTLDTEDSPEVVERMSQYLIAFDASRARASNADELVAAMKQQYPDWAVDYILIRAAKAAFPPPPAGK